MTDTFTPIFLYKNNPENYKFKKEISKSTTFNDLRMIIQEDLISKGYNYSGNILFHEFDEIEDNVIKTFEDDGNVYKSCEGMQRCTFTVVFEKQEEQPPEAPEVPEVPAVPPPPPPEEPEEPRPQPDKYESWLKGNKALFNIFDLLEGQDKIKNFYLNASNLKPVDINKVFIKLYILIYIKFKNFITKENLTNYEEEILAVSMYLNYLEVNEGDFLSTKEIKQKILDTTTPRNGHELGKYISFYARLTKGIGDFIDHVFSKVVSGGGKRRKQKRKSVRRSRKRVSRKRSPKKRTLKKRH